MGQFEYRQAEEIRDVENAAKRLKHLAVGVSQR